MCSCWFVIFTKFALIINSIKYNKIANGIIVNNFKKWAISQMCPSQPHSLSHLIISTIWTITNMKTYTNPGCLVLLLTSS